MKKIKNIRSLFKHWKKCNKQFRSRGEIKSERWEQAIESFVHFLELHDINPIDAEKYISYIDHRIGYMYYIWPILLGYIGENLMIAFEATKQARLGLSVILIVISVLHFPIKWFVNGEARDLTTADNNFLRIALKCYLERHKRSNDFNILMEVGGGLNILVPPNAELVYDEKMISSKYYLLAYRIEIKDCTQQFNYVFFVNQAYGKDRLIERFQMQCYEQIGKLWDEDTINKAVTMKLAPVNFLDYT